MLQLLLVAQTELSAPADPKRSGYNILPWGNRAHGPAHSSPACLPLPKDPLYRGETSYSMVVARQLQEKAGTGAPTGTGRAPDSSVSPSGAETYTHPSLSFSEFLVCRQDFAMAAFAL